MMPGDKFEEDETEAGAEGEGGMEEPEVRRGPFLEEAADVADHRVGGEEGEIIEADDRGVDRFRRVLCKQRQTDRQHVGETDAVQEVERDRPEEPDLLSGALG